VNEARFAYSNLSVLFGGNCAQFKGCIPDPTGNVLAGLANFNFTGLHALVDLPGAPASDTGVSLQTIGAANNLPQGRVVNTYQIVDNFSKTWGRHQFKFGAEVDRHTNSVPFLPNINGSFRINSASRLLNNDPSQVTLAVGQFQISYNETDQYYYAQDDWRIKDNLTLNLGVRYEYSGQPVNTLHDLTLKRESDPSTAIWKQSLPLDVRTFPKIASDKNNFAPRLGFAWRPSFKGRLARTLFGEQDKTVISGGYSIAYDPSFYNILLNVSTASPSVFNLPTVNPAPGAGPVAFPVPANATGAGVQGFPKS